MKKLVFFILFLATIGAHAQTEQPELITDRPDQTESAAVVPYRYLQIESGFSYAKSETDYSKQGDYSYNSTLLRYGLFEGFELRLGLEYLGTKITDKATDEADKTNGFGPLYTGFKVALVEENGPRPQIAFLGDLELSFTANEAYKAEHTGSSMRFAFSNTLSDRFSLGYNLGMQWTGSSSAPVYNYSISLGAGITDQLGAYIECFGYLPELEGQENLLDGGLTYLISPNFQLDLSAGIGLYDRVDQYISFGFSYRIPN